MVDGRREKNDERRRQTIAHSGHAGAGSELRNLAATSISRCHIAWSRRAGVVKWEDSVLITRLAGEYSRGNDDDNAPSAKK